MKTIKVKKGQILQRKGDLNSKVYYVKSGLLRSYSIDTKGKEHIFVFAPEGWILADNVLAEDPCDFFIDALEDSIAEVYEKDLGKRPPDLNALARRLVVLQRRVIMLMSASGLERYEHFIKTYPDLTQRVSQKMIASYLGITPEALSKAKGDKYRSGEQI